jgi:antagonist of KipI
VSVRIVTGGLQTTVQDLGRVGHQSEGVPVGGAMDRIALRLGNILVGNDERCAGLEAALIGPALNFDQDTLIAVAGADLEPSVDGNAIPMWHPVWVERGMTLRFGRARVGCRTYVAVGGGVDVAPVFGSRSTYLRASFGGLEGRALKSGDLLHCGMPSRLSERICESLSVPGRRVNVGRWSIGTSVRGAYGDDIVARVIAGAHLDALSEVAREVFFAATFRVSASSDRMGYRLDGTELSLQEPLELLSEGTVFGTVQLPPGGMPIVLMADAQTTGGYPRIAEVATADLPLVAQLKPGDRLRFRLVSLEEAHTAYFAAERDIAQARAAISLRFPRG